MRKYVACAAFALLVFSTVIVGCARTTEIGAPEVVGTVPLDANGPAVDSLSPEDQGLQDGEEAGREAFSEDPTGTPGDPEVPDTSQYDDEQDKADYEQGYSDGFQSGWENAQEEAATEDREYTDTDTGATEP